MVANNNFNNKINAELGDARGLRGATNILKQKCKQVRPKKAF